MTKPTIAGRMRELLFTLGPLTREQLAEHLVAEGATTSRAPLGVVEQRLRRERDLLELGDGRIDLLPRRLNGVVQTYRLTPHARLVGEIAPGDLTLLQTSPSLTWVDGTPLRRPARYWSHVEPRTWLTVPSIAAFAAGDLLGFRAHEGAVSIEHIASLDVEASAERESIVIDELRRKNPNPRYDYEPGAGRPIDPTSALISLLLLDPALFAEPMAPLTELIDRAGLPREPVRIPHPAPDEEFWWPEDEERERYEPPRQSLHLVTFPRT